jgi:hypothetical protein
MPRFTSHVSILVTASSSLISGMIDAVQLNSLIWSTTVARPDSIPKLGELLRASSQQITASRSLQTRCSGRKASKLASRLYSPQSRHNCTAEPWQAQKQSLSVHMVLIQPGALSTRPVENLLDHNLPAPAMQLSVCTRRGKGEGGLWVYRCGGCACTKPGQSGTRRAKSSMR